MKDTCRHGVSLEQPCNDCVQYARVFHAMNTNPILTAITRRIEAQTGKGIVKYGEAVKSSNLSLLEWLEHRQQEAVDQMVYMECIKFLIESDKQSQVAEIAITALRLIAEAKLNWCAGVARDALKQIDSMTGVLPSEGQAKTPQDE